MRLIPLSGTPLKLSLIAVLALLTYLPALSQPFIEDDYPIILSSRSYGPVSRWTMMAQDKVNRVRATTFVLTHWIEKLAGVKPIWFYSTSLLLHILNCWLIYALGRWSLVGYEVSFWAASFFAIYEGHQEAVMWYAAANELLLFFFAMVCLLFWLTFLERGKLRWLLGAALSFFLALISKESAIILVPLLLLVAIYGNDKKRVLVLGLFVLAALVYAALIFQTRESSFRFHDQSFVLSAPFWETWTKSFFALLLPWGWLAVLVLPLHRREPVLSFSVIWIGISFVPYMFVDYVHSIPSRQTYLASFGLALLVGTSLSCLSETITQRYRPALVLLVLTILAHNVLYIYLVKHKQFLRRAQPTEELISFARSATGPIYVKCFPRPPIIADAAVEVMASKQRGFLVWTESEARELGVTRTYCYRR